MKQHLFCRFDVRWPEQGDRQAVVELMVARQVERWTKLVPGASPDDSRGRWLSDRVLEVRVASVVFWVVLTEGEVSLFWNAPIAARVLLTESLRQTILDAVRRDFSEALVAG
ncbi:MAG: hypothetical protein JOY66_00610 [Acetobacteraceae bacterium]|nr:hypothetical protein [Acetobacteraceae bacterium]